MKGCAKSNMDNGGIDYATCPARLTSLRFVTIQTQPAGANLKRSGIRNKSIPQIKE
jgi:hypothetical protein